MNSKVSFPSAGHKSLNPGISFFFFILPSKTQATRTFQRPKVLKLCISGVYFHKLWCKFYTKTDVSFIRRVRAVATVPIWKRLVPNQIGNIVIFQENGLSEFCQICIILYSGFFSQVLITYLTFLRLWLIYWIHTEVNWIWSSKCGKTSAV